MNGLATIEFHLEFHNNRLDDQPLAYKHYN